jgi:hypothetical protein
MSVTKSHPKNSEAYNIPKISVTVTVLVLGSMLIVCDYDRYPALSSTNLFTEITNLLGKEAS